MPSLLPAAHDLRRRLAPSALLHAYCLALRSACSVFVDMAHAGAVTEVGAYALGRSCVRVETCWSCSKPQERPCAPISKTAPHSLSLLIAGRRLFRAHLWHPHAGCAALRWENGMHACMHASRAARACAERSREVSRAVLPDLSHPPVA